VQRLEAALNMKPFIEYTQAMLSKPLYSSDESELEEAISSTDKIINGVVLSRTGRLPS
jgi:hypothetical protein